MLLVDFEHLEQVCTKGGLVAVYFKVRRVTVFTLLKEECVLGMRGDVCYDSSISEEL